MCIKQNFIHYKLAMIIKRNIIGEPHDFFICGKDTDDNKVLFEKAKQIVEKCISEIISQ